MEVQAEASHALHVCSRPSVIPLCVLLIYVTCVCVCVCGVITPSHRVEGCVCVCVCEFLRLSALFFMNEEKPLGGSLTPGLNDVMRCTGLTAWKQPGQVTR